MLPGKRPATSWVHYTTNCNTQSSTPEDGWDHSPKHVELIGIINKLLLLLLVGCLYHYTQVPVVRSRTKATEFTFPCHTVPPVYFRRLSSPTTHHYHTRIYFILSMPPQQVLTHSLTLLKIVKIIARNMLS